MRANVKLSLLFFIAISNYVTAQKNSDDSVAYHAPAAVVKSKLNLPMAGCLFDWQTNSTAFTNSFLLDVRRDLVLTRESVDNSAKKLKNTNYFVNYAEGGIYYVFPLKKDSNLGIVIESSAATFQDASFHKNTYNLVLYGNARYRNEKLDFSGLFYRNIEYQKIGVGIRNYFQAKTQCITATIDFILGDYANQFKIERGSIFTEQNGEFLDIDLRYERHTSSLGAGINNPKGYGAALNINWIKLFAKAKTTLCVEIRNMGLVHYGATTGIQTVDTAIHFTGIDLGAFSSVSSFSSAGLKDSILNKFNLESREEAFNFTLPSLLGIRVEHVLSPRSIIQFQTNAYLYNALPMLKVGYLYLLNKNLYLGTGTRIGGYSKFDLDLMARYRNKKMYFEFSLKSIEGLLNPKQGSGLGAFLDWSFYLK